MTDKFTIDDLGAELLPDGDPARADIPPYHILLVADFAGSEQVRLAGVINDQILPVTADSFDALMAAACPITLGLKLVDPIKGGNCWVELQATADGALQRVLPAYGVAGTPSAMNVPTLDVVNFVCDLDKGRPYHPPAARGGAPGRHRRGGRVPVVGRVGGPHHRRDPADRRRHGRAPAASVGSAVRTGESGSFYDMVGRGCSSFQSRRAKLNEPELV